MTTDTPEEAELWRYCLKFLYKYNMRKKESGGDDEQERADLYFNSLPTFKSVCKDHRRNMYKDLKEEGEDDHEDDKTDTFNETETTTTLN